MKNRIKIFTILLLFIPISAISQCPGSGFDPCNAVPITVNGSCETMRANNYTNFTNPGTCGSEAYRDVWGTYTVGAENDITISYTLYRPSSYSNANRIKLPVNHGVKSLMFVAGILEK